MSVVGPTTACTTLQLPDFPAPAGADVKRTSDNRVEISAYPMRKLEDQHTYFGTDLTPKGILPIWLSIHNRTPADSMAFNLSDVQIETQGRTVAEPSRARAPIDPTDEELATILSVWVGAKMRSDSAAIRSNMMAKKFYSTTLSPGETASGFIYASVDPAGQQAGAYKMTIVVHQIPVPPSDVGRHYTITF
jgi:hypothetical protein